MSSLIRGTSMAEDVGEISMSAAVAFHRIRARVWYEWLDSESNPADGLSRAGASDPWTCEQPWDICEVQPDTMDNAFAFVHEPFVLDILGK